MRKELTMAVYLCLLPLLLMILSCCKRTVYVYEGVVPIREECDRYETPLPLDDLQAVHSIWDFIRRGGACRDDDAVERVDSASFMPFLNLFLDSTICNYQVFQSSPEIATFIQQDSSETSVFDTRRRHGPDKEKRRAYKLSGYWFIFYLKHRDTTIVAAAENTADTTVLPLAKAQWRYTNLIVQKDFVVHGQR